MCLCDPHLGGLQLRSHQLEEQEQFGGENCYVDFSNPDFKLLAEAMRCKGYRVEGRELSLEEAQTGSVVVPVDYSENMSLRNTSNRCMPRSNYYI